MEEKISVWLVGNTGLRSPNRIQDGLKIFAQSQYVGNLHGEVSLKTRTFTKKYVSGVVSF